MSEDTKPTDALKDEVSEAVDTVKAAAADAKDAVADAVADAKADAKDAVADAKADAKETVADVKDAVADAVADAKADANEAQEAIAAAENATELVETTKSEPKPAKKADKKPARKHAAAEPEPAAPAKAEGPSKVVWIALMCAALVLGVLLGKFVLGGGAAGASGALSGKTAVTEAELDSVMATYTYKGKTGSVTVREIIEQEGSLEAAIDAEGNYTLPAADSALSAVRNNILEMEAENLGLTVTDEEIAAYSEETLGTSDYASIAESYSMTEDAVVSIMKSSAVMSKLRDSVVEASDATMPEAPAEPATTTETVVNEETGEEEQSETTDTTTPTKEYADYIIALVGDEWDSTTGTWASTDGTYASALSTYDITPEGASYEAAQTAYYVAYQIYSEAQNAVQTQWSDYVNGLLSQATITMNTLVA